MSDCRNSAHGIHFAVKQANTFFARPDLKCPPGRMAYALADGKKKAQDKLSAVIKIGRISATIFDDMGGLVCVSFGGAYLSGVSCVENV